MSALAAIAGRIRTLRPSSAQVTVAIVMFLTGAAGWIYECVLSTVLTNLLGSSQEQHGVTIGIMMSMMAIGGLLPLKVERMAVQLFIVAEILLMLLGGFSPTILQWAFVTLPGWFVAVKLAFPALIGLLIGLEIPLMMSINKRFAKNLQSNIAGTWVFDYVGCAVGTFAWWQLLKIFVPVHHTALWAAAFNLLAIVICLAFFWRRGMLGGRVGRTSLIATTFVAIIATWFGASNVDAWSQMAFQKMYDAPIVFQATTKYQHIVMTKGVHPRDPMDSNYELYLNGNKQFSSVDEAYYHEYLVHPAMSLAGSRERVLVLGGGDGLAVREILKYPDVKQITLVDLDPEMIRLAQTNPILKRLNKNAFGDARVRSNLKDSSLNAGIADKGVKQPVFMKTDEVKVSDCHETIDEFGSPKSECKTEPIFQEVAKVNIFTIDADKFISTPPGEYDVVIVDLPDPNSVELAKLYSREFYAKIKRSMTPEAIVVVQAGAIRFAKEAYMCIMRTMMAAGLNVLPYHVNVDSFAEWGWHIASPSLTTKELRQRVTTLGSFRVKTTRVAAVNMIGATIFHIGELETKLDSISTVMDPKIASYYAYEDWKID